MRPDFIFHVGANKTGSSAIQRFISENVHNFWSADIALPDYQLEWGNEISGEQVLRFAALMEHPDAKQQISEVLDRLYATRPPGSTVLISAENLANLSNPGAWAEALAKFHVQVILYIRRQDEFLASSWQQWHSKTNLTFDSWLTEGTETLGHWESIILSWEELVGRDRLDVRIFDRDSFVENNIVLDFAEAIGLTCPREALILSNEPANPSPHPAVTALVSGNTAIFANEHDNNFFDLTAPLSSTLYSGSNVSLMTKSQRETVIAAYAEENERVRARCFPDRETLFPQVDHSRYEYPDFESEVRVQLRFLTEVAYGIVKERHERQ